MKNRTDLMFLPLFLFLAFLSGCATKTIEEKYTFFSLAAPEHYDVWVEHLEFEKPGIRHWRWPGGSVTCCWKGPDGPFGSGGTMSPFPKYIGIQWFSYADQKFYQRLIILPENLKKQMQNPAQYTTSKGTFERPRDRLVIGLAPGGTIVLWIMNQIGNEIEVARFQANEIDGDPSRYKAATEQYLEENGDYLDEHGIPKTGW
ncbi:DUF2931 family protein [Marinobacter bohaiensis]|uniref:DUF2931 family protein n=1 Tax=Marinobacter bohaiensis TaxID=2201898 RepID=UPI001D172E66|nr:DUF2931 family protein [Marinobacter bohaiensis]